MNQKKHLNAIAALEASKDAEPGSYWDGDWCQGFDCARCYADKICELYADTKTRRAALQSGLDAYHKRKAEKAERRAAEAANSPDSQTITIPRDPDAETKPLIPDPPDTPEVRKQMEAHVGDSFLKDGACVGACQACFFRPVCLGKDNRQARHDFALSWLSRHPAVWDAEKGAYPAIFMHDIDKGAMGLFTKEPLCPENWHRATLSEVLPLIFDGPRQFADEARRQGWKR